MILKRNRILRMRWAGHVAPMEERRTTYSVGGET
jgi:hypothetical protein